MSENIKVSDNAGNIPAWACAFLFGVIFAACVTFDKFNDAPVTYKQNYITGIEIKPVSPNQARTYSSFITLEERVESLRYEAEHSRTTEYKLHNYAAAMNIAKVNNIDGFEEEFISVLETYQAMKQTDGTMMDSNTIQEVGRVLQSYKFQNFSASAIQSKKQEFARMVLEQMERKGITVGVRYKDELLFMNAECAADEAQVYELLLKEHIAIKQVRILRADMSLYAGNCADEYYDPTIAYDLYVSAGKFDDARTAARQAEIDMTSYLYRKKGVTPHWIKMKFGTRKDFALEAVSWKKIADGTNAISKSPV